MRSKVRRWSAALVVSWAFAASAQVQRTEVNFGFEAPDLGTVACFARIADEQVPGWTTTHAILPAGGSCTAPLLPPSGAAIEIWNSGFNGVPSHAGKQHAELNAEQNSRIFQNICLTNGETVAWRMSHRGRASATSPDVMDFGINDFGDTGTPILERVARVGTTQTGLDQIDGVGTPSFADQGTLVAGAITNAWRDYSGAFVYSGPTTVRQLGFAAVSAGGGNTTIGNFLDDIQVNLTPYIELTASSASVAEGGTLALRLHVMGTVKAGGITIPLSVSGTASHGSDYTIDANVVIPPGEYDDQFIPVALTIVNDALEELDETLVVSLGPSTPEYTIASTTTCGGAPIASETITILDDDRLPARVTVSKVASAGPVHVGDTMTFTVTVNVATSMTSGDMTIVDTLGAGLVFMAVTNTGAFACSGALTCVLPGGTPPGTYTLTYSATVDATANAGVGNSIVASGTDAPTCMPCTTSTPVEPAGGTVSQATIAKTADAPARASVGDVITYTVTTTIANAMTTDAILVSDQLDAGLTFGAVTHAGAYTCTGALTCRLPAGTTPGIYPFVYTATVNAQAQARVRNSVSAAGANVVGASASVDTPVDSGAPTLRVAKRAMRSEVRVGEFVRYEIIVDNTGTTPAIDARLIDTPPPGFTFVDGSLTVEGDDVTRLSTNAPITIEHIDIAPGTRVTVAYLMRVGASAHAGTYVNRVHMEVGARVASGTAFAEVDVVADPIFDASTIVGTVFEDRDGDGEQDPGEPGIPGARVATVTGLLVETDRFGRYHIADVEVHAGRGRNVLLKLDRASLPIGFVPTTPNPLLRRVTPGLPVRFDFGVKPEARP